MIIIGFVFTLYTGRREKVDDLLLDLPYLALLIYLIPYFLILFVLNKWSSFFVLFLLSFPNLSVLFFPIFFIFFFLIVFSIPVSFLSSFLVFLFTFFVFPFSFLFLFLLSNRSPLPSVHGVRKRKVQPQHESA